MLIFKGQCPCKKIEFEATGEPLFTQYCHCNKCREVASLSNSEQDKSGYGMTAAYLKENFNITKGKDALETLPRNHSNLLICSGCKSLIYGVSQDPDKQAGIGINMNNFKFKHNELPHFFNPKQHTNYAERVIDFNDDLPKYKDKPLEQLGSGELM